MNFLHINMTDIRGGAARSMYRFHRALLEQGHGSHILCGFKELEGGESSQIVPGRFWWFINTIIGCSFDWLGLQACVYLSSLFMRKNKMVLDWADVIIIRNVHGSYISLGMISWLLKQKPLIWRMPDMWPITGHCVYAYECYRWRIGCGKCPRLYEYPGLAFDTTSFLWKRKRKLYTGINRDLLALVSPSKWLLSYLRMSPLTSNIQSKYISTGVDLRIFRPLDRSILRLEKGISSIEKVVMVSGASKRDAFRKGFDLLPEIFSELLRFVDIPVTLLVLGSALIPERLPDKVRIIKLGFVRTDKELAKCYNVADVFLCTSRADNMPNTLVEAASCGVPIVTFENGGCAEAVSHSESGYVVSGCNDCSKAIADILNSSDLQRRLSKASVTFAEQRFDMALQVCEYVRLARDLRCKR